MKRIAEEGTVQHIEGIPDEIKRLWVCSHDISCDWHVRMQAAFQKHTDCAVSKTINLPETSTAEDVRDAYIKAWQLGLKGITVYRDGSRISQVLNIGRTDPLKKAASAGLVGTVSSPRKSAALQKASGVEDNFRQHRRIPIDQPSPRLRGRSAETCPECRAGSALLFRYEACFKCRTCGYTKC